MAFLQVSSLPYPQNGVAEVQDLPGGHPQVQFQAGRDSFGRKIPAQDHVEADNPRGGVRHSLEADVVDVGVGIIVPGARDGDVEFPRQICPFGVAKVVVGDHVVDGGAGRRER